MYSAMAGACSDGFDNLLVWLALCCTLLTMSVTFAARSYNSPRSRMQLQQAGLRMPPSPPGLPIIGHLHLIGPVCHRSFHKLAQTYGPIMLLRLGNRPTLVISSAALAKLVLHLHDQTFAHRPPSHFAHLVFYRSQNPGFMDMGPRWRALRTLYAQHLLSPKILSTSKHVRDEEMRGFIHKLRSVHHMDVRAVILGLQLNVMTRLLFSERMEGSGQLESLPDVFREVSEAFERPLVGEFVPVLRGIIDVGGVEKKVARQVARMDAILESMVRKRLARVASTGSAPGDMLTAILQFEGKISAGDRRSSSANYELLHRLEDPTDNIDTAKAVLLELLAASTDITTATVEWVIAELLINRESVLKKLQEEVDRQMEGSGKEQVEEEQLEGMPYLEAVMKESLRLHPPAPTMLPHFAKEATQVEGYFVPKNTILIVNAWAIGRDETVWEDAQRFRPERFLEGGKESHVSWGAADNFQLLAFGKGRRGCPGRHMGLLMASLVVANLVRTFDWHTSEPPDLLEKVSLTNMLARPLLLKLSYRQHQGMNHK